MIKDWKLKLKYGKLKTPFNHYTIIAPVLINEYSEEYAAQSGKAYVGLKIWAENDNVAISMFENLAHDAHFKITGNMELYETDPIEPPTEKQYSYGITFSYYND